MGDVKKSSERPTSWKRARGVLLLCAAVVLAACGHSEPSPPVKTAADAPALVIPPLPVAGAAAIPALVESEPAPLAFVEPAGPPIAARDPRLTRHRPQSRAHVMTEIQSLERRLDTTRKDAPDRPQLRRRIADGYNDLANTSSGAERARARTESIKHYTALVTDHPNAAELDEVLYFLALDHELNSDPQNARKCYHELITRAPTSKYVPLAYFAFGEMFYAEGISDPIKYELALQAFAEVLKYPAPPNPIVPETLLRVGDIHRRRGEAAKAKASFQKLAHDFPSSSATTQIPTLVP